MSVKTLASRFWSKVDKRSGAECWPWIASRHDTGYGQIYYGERNGGSRKEFSHRVAWLLTNGQIPDGRHVLHVCDNRLCCNPSHMFLGSNDDNILDKLKKGRQTKGESHPCHKLSEEHVRRIRQDKRTLQSIADDYGVHPITIFDAKAGRTWKHVE